MESNQNSLGYINAPWRCILNTCMSIDFFDSEIYTHLQDWPISGGERQETRKSRDLLLTGHEDGSVKFWNVSTVSMQLLYKVNTASYFEEGFTEQGMKQHDCGCSDIEICHWYHEYIKICCNKVLDQRASCSIVVPIPNIGLCNQRLTPWFVCIAELYLECLMFYNSE